MTFARAAMIAVTLACARFAFAGSPLTDLSTTLGLKASVYSINDAGVMVGMQQLDGGKNDDHRAMFWAPGEPARALGLLGRRTRAESIAHRVNNRNVVVGVADADGCPRAFVFTPNSGIRDLGTLGGGYSTANDVNDAGEVVGWASGDQGRFPFRWRGRGEIERLETPAVNGEGSANGINARGDIVGGFELPERPGKRRAFLCRANRSPQHLGTLGGTESEAGKINDSGVFVGHSDLRGDAEHHAFRGNVADGKLIDLGVLPGDTRSAAFAINNAKVIVGASGRGRPDDMIGRRAVAWLPNGQLVDLTAWLRKTDPPTGKRWRLGTPAAINSSNHVVGYGYFDADGDGKFESPRPFLLDVSDLVKR